MRAAPWHVKGINPQARETAREAARRSGMSVGQWLNAVILDQADRVDDEDDDAHPYDDTHPYKDLHSYKDLASKDLASDRGDDLASINARLDDLGRQIQRLAGHHVGG